MLYDKCIYILCSKLLKTSKTTKQSSIRVERIKSCEAECVCDFFYNLLLWLPKLTRAPQTLVMHPIRTHGIFLLLLHLSFINDTYYSRPPDKSAYWKIIFFISHPKHMLWVLKRTVSMRRLFKAPKTHVLLNG